ncbi:MAG: SET domain-containing protein-lysine N-methyltransferase [Spirochaetales bacterium]|nr:SET domain-containing protein-lysine N-methyltransferase [Spirochaetales bacterium]
MIYKTKKEIDILFRNLELRHIKFNEMIYPEQNKINLRKSSYYSDNLEEFVYLEEKYGEKLNNKFRANIYIKKVNDQIGYGLFAVEPLKADDLIGEYTGIVQEAFHLDPSDKETSAKTEYAWDYPDDIPGLPPLEINARYAGGVLRFVNHSFHPNLRIEHAVIENEWKIFFVADENIEADAELFVDYGDAYWAVESREIIIP